MYREPGKLEEDLLRVKGTAPWDTLDVGRHGYHFIPAATSYAATLSDEEPSCGSCAFLREGTCTLANAFGGYPPCTGRDDGVDGFFTKDLKTSGSRLEEFEGCKRSWALKMLFGCKDKRSEATMIGDVGHAVCDRYLGSEDNLYPKDWEIVTNRFSGEVEGKVGSKDQALVQVLIETAIANGHLQREPDGEPEQYFSMVVGVYRDTYIVTRGFLDFCYGPHVLDHKFIGKNSLKYYNKKKLLTAPAMILYSVSRMNQGGWDEMWMGYNLFIKDPKKPRVHRLEERVSREYLETRMSENIIPHCEAMVDGRRNWKVWSDAPMADNPKVQCNKFSREGCPFKGICAGTESVEEYKARFDGKVPQIKGGCSREDILARMQQPITPKRATSTTSETGEINMSRLANLAAQANGTAAPAAPATPAAPAPATASPAAAAPAAAAPEVVQQTAPWFWTECPKCGTNPVQGMSVEFEPCQVCVAMSSDAALAPDQFDIGVAEGGVVTITAKGAEAPVAAAPAVDAAAAVVTEDIATAPAAAPVAAAEAPAVVAPAATVAAPAPAPVEAAPVVAAAAPVEAAPAEAALPTLPTEAWGVEGLFSNERLGFTLCYAPVRSGKKSGKKLGVANCVVRITELSEVVFHHILVAANEAGAGKSNFYDLDTWDRRALISKNAEKIAGLVGNSVIEASGVPKGTDEWYILFAIERYATVVIGDLS